VSDRVLVESFTEVMPEADAEALRHALRNLKTQTLINSYTLTKQTPLSKRRLLHFLIGTTTTTAASRR
jgi:hypothetical protein